MTSIWTDEHRHDPANPVALSPNAASEGGPDSAGGGVGVDFFLNIAASLGSVAESMQAEREHRDRHCPPGNEQLFRSATFPAVGTTLTLDLGSVPIGRVWQVRRLIVGGSTVTATATGSAFVFAQGAPPVDLNITNCKDIFMTLPPAPVPRYGTHQFFLVATAHLWVVINAGTVGEQYTAAADIESWDDAAFGRSFVE